MKTYLLILLEKGADTSASIYEKSVEALSRQVAHRILPIPPHLVLLQSETEMNSLARSLSSVLATCDAWLLLEIASQRWLAPIQQSDALKHFFHSTT
jgi:hypothetical protein